jgi:hypothetical protein
MDAMLACVRRALPDATLDAPTNHLLLTTMQDDVTGPRPPPRMERKLRLTPRRVAAVALLAALPVASLAGAFSAREQQSASASGLSLRVRYPVRTLYRHDEELDIELSSTRLCERALVQLSGGYLAKFDRLHSLPPAPSRRILYQGPVRLGELRSVLVQGQPAEAGLASGTLSFDCESARGPRVELATIIFP